MSEALARLALLHGIAPDYRDVWGNERRAPETTLRALLGALGVAAKSDAEVDATLAREHVAARAAGLPAAIVARESAPVRVTLAAPSSMRNEDLRWQLTEESGRHVDGAWPASDAQFDRAGNRSTEECSWVLPHVPPPGYHRLTVRSATAVVGETLLIVAPARCYQPPALCAGDRIWGVAAQLYGVRSQRNWGIGDFTDLGAMMEVSAGRGADIVGVNPLHALFPLRPSEASPYSPSSRLFLNTLYLDVAAVADVDESPAARESVASAGFQAELKRLRAAELVDYAGVATAKARVLALAYQHFCAAHLARESERGKDFHQFCAAGGSALKMQALFDALAEHFGPACRGWQDWPEPYRDPESDSVARFAAEHADRLAYHQYLQWQAELQLARVRARSSELGLEVGLYVDLAVSVDRSGAESWANQRLYAVEASIGAPPDAYNLAGQNWNLPPLAPARLRDAAYAPFIATLRASMRHAGALRIDHVMGLMRLFWIPPGAKPTEGAYVYYPRDDLLGILALESQRHRCLVIGEDLGTVPEALREALAAAGVLSYRVLYFERDSAGDFLPPAAYPTQAVVTASTHDLPTLIGWWEGRDLALRAEAGLFPSEASRAAQLAERSADRERLLRALAREGLLPAGVAERPDSAVEMSAQLAQALQVALARTPALVQVVQLEDALGSHEQANLPATVDEHPNWKRKLPVPAEEWPALPRWLALTEALREARPRSSARARSPAPRLRPRVPRATYRLQLHQEFTFADAVALVPYLAELGVSHVYCSPYLRARPGSRHGYDIVDHASFNPEIGDAEGFERFVAELARHGMGQIADMVPNHMAVMGADNAWWMDVLENGPASAFASYFDIDWQPIDADLVGKVLLPVLGDHYGRVLERGEIKLRFEPDAGVFALRYDEHRLPIDPRAYPALLLRAQALSRGALPAAADDELASVVAALAELPARTESSPDRVRLRQRDKEIAKRRLSELVRGQPSLSRTIERAVSQFNAAPQGEALHELLEAQAYRVAYWRVASDEINYRRFFDVNALAALRMEDDAVFEATHRRILALAVAGRIDGLRIDHPDGLYDPAAYFARLQQRYAELAGHGADEERPLYVVIEKIEAPHEQLPQWPIHGTTGYRFASLVNGLFVDAAARLRVDRAWRAFVGEEALDFDQAKYLCRRAITRSTLAAELSTLANRLLRIARADRRTRDFTLSTLWQALADVASSFPVYRTYVAQRVSVQDRRSIDWAVSVARKRSRSADASVFDFVRDVLLVKPPEGAPAEVVAAYRAFAMRYQQFTGPVMAKGVEDTSFYVFNRLASLNEVGADPDQFGTSVKAFHRANAERLARWPDTMLAGSTHDNKRSVDVRARIDVISEMPAAWRLAMRRWSRMNRRHKSLVGDKPSPSRNDEYLLYQTLIGTYPPSEPDAAELARYRERIERYMIKSAREAKLHTSWLTVSLDYEAALSTFVSALLNAASPNPFLPELASISQAFAWFGALNSVAMSLLHFTAPGVPDLYQGDEIVQLALVDPDNRGAVDYGRRRDMLHSLQRLAAGPADGIAPAVRSLLAAPHDGRLKLWVTWRALTLRRERPHLFARGRYVRLAVSGECSRHVVAYARECEGVGVVVLAGRLFAQLGLAAGDAPVGEAVWGDTTVDLSPLSGVARLNDLLSGETLSFAGRGFALAQAFAYLPVALLVYAPSSRA